MTKDLSQKEHIVVPYNPMEKSLPIKKASFDDEKTWTMLLHGGTSGVFQVESQIYTDALKRFNHIDLNTIIDAIALLRPGPMDEKGVVDSYISRKNGTEKTAYDHPLLEPILNKTYGIILFQEQCSTIANQLAGYTLAEADTFRKAISKKDEKLEKERSRFIAGCASANNIDGKTAEKIFNQIVTFAGYAFNKSHSVAYALISAWTAYLKANYPIEYMTKLLSSQTLEENIRKYIRESKNLGLTVGPPRINVSEGGFCIDPETDNTILFGLAKIKGIGEGVAEHIIKHRPFVDFVDFVAKVDKQMVDTRLMTTLIKAGCFRVGSPYTTKQLLENSDDIVKQFKSKRLVNPQNGARHTLKIWGLEKKKTGKPLEYSLLELAQMERETLGFYVTTHPIQHLANKKALNSPRYFEISRMYEAGKEFYTIGVLTDKVRTRKSRRGIVFNELEMEDMNALVKLPVFGNKHEEVLRVLKPGDAIAIRLKNSKGRLYPEMIKLLDFEV